MPTRHPLFSHPALACLFAVAALLTARTATAQEFKVESKVFVGPAAKDQQPVSESVTLFHNGRAYDFLSSPREVTLFDVTGQRIVLLNLERRLKTEVPTARLTEFVEGLRTRAAQADDAVLRFAAAPKFEIEQQTNQWRKFAAPEVTYRVQLAPAESEAAAKAYREFSDWSARLNSLLRKGALPPFPRLAVNAALERDGKLPGAVELTIAARAQTGGKPTVLRSEHTITWRLSGSDKKQIEQTGEQLVTFPTVSLDEYLRPVAE